MVSDLAKKAGEDPQYKVDMDEFGKDSLKLWLEDKTKNIELQNRIKELENKVDELETHIKYMPDGDGYFKAKESYEGKCS